MSVSKMDLTQEFPKTSRRMSIVSVGPGLMRGSCSSPCLGVSFMSSPACEKKLGAYSANPEAIKARPERSEPIVDSAEAWG